MEGKNHRKTEILESLTRGENINNKLIIP